MAGESLTLKVSEDPHGLPLSAHALHAVAPMHSARGMAHIGVGGTEARISSDVESSRMQFGCRKCPIAVAGTAHHLWLQKGVTQCSLVGGAEFGLPLVSGVAEESGKIGRASGLGEPLPPQQNRRSESCWLH